MSMFHHKKKMLYQNDNSQKRKREDEFEKRGKRKMEDESEVFNDGYGEDLMGDDADREFLMGLPEVERETILFERHERRLALKRQREQKGKGNQRDLKRGTTQSSLMHLKEKRMEQKRKRIQQEQMRSYEMEATDFLEDNDDYSPPDEKVPIQRNPVPPFESIAAITLRRTILLNLYSKVDDFNDLIEGCFMKILVGENPQLNSRIYRLCQIERIHQADESYLVEGLTIPFKMEVRIGNATNIYHVDKVSNLPLEEIEYQYWLSVMNDNMERESGDQVDKIRFPDPSFLKAKQNAIDTAQRIPLTEQALNRRIEQAQKNRIYTIQDTEVVLQKELTKRVHEYDLLKENQISEKEKLEREIAHLKDLIKQKKEIFRQSQIQPRTISVAKYEKKHLSSKRMKKKLTSRQQKDDPFTRIATTSSMFGKHNDTPKKEQRGSDDPPDASPKSDEPIDQYSLHDFDLGIDL